MRASFARPSQSTRANGVLDFFGLDHGDASKDQPLALKSALQPSSFQIHLPHS